MITQENLKTLLESLGFTKDSKKLIYTKHFENVNTSLSVDFTKKAYVSKRDYKA